MKHTEPEETGDLTCLGFLFPHKLCAPADSEMHLYISKDSDAQHANK